MSSINKYYTFLKENNISTYESLKDFIHGDLYKLKTKEDKDFNNLAIIYNDKNSNIENELVRFFNGVIIDKNTLKIVCYTFDKCLEEDNLNEDGTLPFRFEYTIIDNVGIPRDNFDEEFFTLIGDILVDIIHEQSEEDNVKYVTDD